MWKLKSSRKATTPKRHKNVRLRNDRESDQNVKTNFVRNVFLMVNIAFCICLQFFLLVLVIYTLKYDSCDIYNFKVIISPRMSFE